MDVLEVEKHKAYFQQVIDHFGHLDVLVNNAGRSQRAIWEEIELAVDKEMFNLNVFSVLSLSRIAVQHFMKQNEGHIVVTSSLAGVMAAPYSASYIGAKHAIHGYFDALRLEKMMHNITVTLLCPGPVFSNILADSFTGRPKEKFGKPMEITDRRMSTERCGHLCAVAIANKLDEAWMALPPIIFMVHFLICYPNVASLVTRFLGPKFFVKMRDTKVRMEIKSD
ncbi:hypothetical protein B7P43_G03781 [Cryptotermes secundus]|nr:hypothetical protein B7P43_G03781 [Cryptotermes secundus]